MLQSDMYGLANSSHAGTVTILWGKDLNLLSPALPNLNRHTSPALFEQIVFFFTGQFTATFFITQFIPSHIIRHGER